MYIYIWNTYMCIYMYTQVYIHICEYICINIYMYMYTYENICICIYIQVYK